uniref:Uncharacterized protein n=1 Tax=Globodera rostochiensis TaxID=31243 RepID=A0A914ICW1_GLORO
MANSITSSVNETIVIWATIFASTEMVIEIVTLLISAFNFSLLYTTALLHPNLKCILLVQSAAIALQEVIRIIFVSLKFANSDMFFHGAIPVQIVGMASLYFRNLMGHVLMAERVFATVYFRTYADNKAKHFTICWMGTLLAISIWNTFVQHGVFFFVNMATFVSACILFVLGLVEILSLSAIYLYNLRKYKSELYFTLNERFQLSENIRTAKQLAPTIFLHFFNSNVLNLFRLLVPFGAQRNLLLIHRSHRHYPSSGDQT